MLRLLHIENIAVIERADLEFEDGLTVLTGETGAGKSIIIDSIGAILGQRTSRQLVRSGASKGFVSAIFSDCAADVQKFLCDRELNGEEPDVLHVQRQISADGKSVCRINMKPVTLTVLKELAPYLMNIHGQHDGQQLMDDRLHILFLDRFAGAGQLLREYQPLYQKLLSLRSQITALEKSEQERMQRIDMLSYHLGEIDGAQLKPGEEETLHAQKKIFDHAGKMATVLAKVYAILDGAEDSDGKGVCELLSDAASSLDQISEVSDALGHMAGRAEELQYLAMDLRDTVGKQQSQIDFSPAEQAQLEERLDLIYRLKQKYGESIESILLYAEQCRTELQHLQTADEQREQLRAEYRTLLSEAKEKARLLSSMRKKAAIQLEKRIVQELSDLDMSKVRFSVHVETGTKLSSKGTDEVSFLISVNPGEELRPLSKVASGGELSRVMLAMKNVLTAQEPVGTLIFDEIDTGVSGRAAQKIAHKLMEIGQKKQTICVTHLPQIAASGLHHMLISKSVSGDKTYTQVHPVTGDFRTAEIARMISGEEVTQASMTNAAELLAGAAALYKGETK